MMISDPQYQVQCVVEQRIVDGAT